MLKAMVIQAARQIRAAARTKGPPRDTKDSFRAGQQRANVPFAGDCRRSHWRNTTRKSRELTASNSDCESSIARPGASSSRQMAKPFNIHQLALPPTPQVDWDFSSMRSIGHCCEYILPWGLRGKEILSSRKESQVSLRQAAGSLPRGRGGEGERGRGGVAVCAAEEPELWVWRSHRGLGGHSRQGPGLRQQQRSRRRCEVSKVHLEGARIAANP